MKCHTLVPDARAFFVFLAATMKRNRNGKDELIVPDPKKPKKEKRKVSEAIIARIPKKKWTDLGLDEGDARVQQVMRSAASKDAFVRAVSRFLYWDARQDKKLYNEKTLISYLSNFLYNLSGADSYCLLDLGSLFPEMSHVKKFLSLKHGADFAKTPELNALLKYLGKQHKPKKAAVFSTKQLEKYCARPIDESLKLKENQETMIALFAFYSLGRKSEIMNLTVGDTILLPSENRILVDISRKKTGGEQKYYVPGGDFDLKSAFEAHLEALEKSYMTDFFDPSTRLWNRFDVPSGKFQQRPIGKNHVSNVAQEIANFNQIPGDFSSHSFRRSAATAIAESGGSDTDLLNAGQWSTTKVARGYLSQSSRQRDRTMSLLQGSAPAFHSCASPAPVQAPGTSASSSSSANTSSSGSSITTTSGSTKSVCTRCWGDVFGMHFPESRVWVL